VGFFGVQSRQREIMNPISYLIDKLQSVANLPIQYAPSISSENVLEDEDEERTKTLYTRSASDGLIYSTARAKTKERQAIHGGPESSERRSKGTEMTKTGKMDARTSFSNRMTPELGASTVPSKIQTP
jgi:hypothetical protein